MVRPVRTFITIVAIVAVLFVLQADVSAKKKSSKRKAKAARRAPVVLMTQSQRNVPVIVTAPVITPSTPSPTANDIVLNMSAPGQRTTPSSAGASNNGISTGDQDGKSMNR